MEEKMKNEILKKIEEIANECAKKLGMEINSVEYVTEFNMKILRIIASKEPTLTIDDSSELNKMISNELDKFDLIEEEYYLEVSSEGLEKELKNDNDIMNAIDEYICIKVYEKIEGQKEFYGDLKSYDNGIIVIDANIKGQTKQILIEKNKISKIRLAVKF